MTPKQPLNEPDKFLYIPCSRCGINEGTLWKNSDVKTRKFLIDALGLHALCMECGYRVPLNNKTLSENKNIKQDENKYGINTE